MVHAFLSQSDHIAAAPPLEPSVERGKRRPRPPADAVESLRSYFSRFVSLPRKSSDRRVACLVFVRPPLLSTTQQIGSATPLCAADKGRWQSLHRAFHLSIIIYFGEWTRPALPRSFVYKNRRLFGLSVKSRAGKSRSFGKREKGESAREREKPPALLLGGTSQSSESPKVEHSQQRRHSRGFMSSPVPRCGTRNAYVCEHLPSWKEPTIGTTNNIYLRSVRAGPFDARPIQPPHLLGLFLVHSFFRRYAICYPSGFSAKAVQGGGEVCVCAPATRHKNLARPT